jgi:hypothetical protein
MVRINAMDGAQLIARERQRQIEKEGWSAEHDDEHDDASLALAAICYAAPIRIYGNFEHQFGFNFADPWPDSWSQEWDKREWKDGAPADPAKSGKKTRLRNLVKAGALIAAEIDRLKRARA